MTSYLSGSQARGTITPTWLSKTQIHTKVGNPPSLPMEAYLESQWPPLHRVHNLYVKHIYAVIIVMLTLPINTQEFVGQLFDKNI